MTAEQIDLQLGERLGRDADLGEVAEAGVDPVDRLVAARRTCPTTAARRVHARARIVGERDRCTCSSRDRGKIVERQRVAGVS